jgi:hypothetical protein
MVGLPYVLDEVTTDSSRATKATARVSADPPLGLDAN